MNRSWLVRTSKRATRTALFSRSSLAYRSRTTTRTTRLLSTSPYGKDSKESVTSEQPGHGSEGNASGKKDSARSPHAQWYTDTVPAMIPIALLGSAVYLGLQLVQTKLATEKYLDEANARIAQLEEEIKRLQSEQEAHDRALGPSGSSSKSKRSNEDKSGAKRSSSRWWWPWSSS